MVKEKPPGGREPRYDAVSLLSGGPDSAALLYHISKVEKLRPLALHFHTGLGSNEKEFKAAKNIASSLGVPFQAIDVSHFVASAGNAMIMIHSDAHVLNFGTAVVLSMASAFAIAHGATSVWVALHKEDAEEANEYTPEFIDFMNKGITMIGKDCTIRAPFHSWPKAKVLEHAQELEVPLARTWSCVSPNKGVQCGVCGACRARRNALEKAKIKDPTKYRFK